MTTHIAAMTTLMITITAHAGMIIATTIIMVMQDIPIAFSHSFFVVINPLIIKSSKIFWGAF